MARKWCDVDIEVRPKDDGGYNFTMKDKRSTDLPDGRQKVTFSKKAEQMSHDDVHAIKFKLHNKDGANIRFTTNLVNVLWACVVNDATGACPNAASHLPGKFFPAEVDDGQDELTVVNANMGPEFYAFRLNFVPAGHKDVPEDQYIAYDPITENQDGQYPFQ